MIRVDFDMILLNIHQDRIDIEQFHEFSGNFQAFQALTASNSRKFEGFFGILINYSATQITSKFILRLIQHLSAS